MVPAKQRVGGGVGRGRGPSAFLEGGTLPPERPGSRPRRIPAARSGELPHRTKRRGNGPVRRTQGAPSGSTVRRIPQRTRGRWRRPLAAARRRREMCLWTIPRYSPSRERATARRHALPRRNAGAACNRSADEPEKESSRRHRSPPRTLFFPLLVLCVRGPSGALRKHPRSALFPLRCKPRNVVQRGVPGPATPVCTAWFWHTRCRARP